MTLSRFAPLGILGFVAVSVPVAACGWPPTTGSTSGTPSTAATSTGTTDPPVIDELDMSNSALTADPSTDTYTIYGSITYTDDDDVVTAFRVYVPVIGHTYTFTQANPIATAYGSPISFTLSADPPLGGAGETTYEVTLVNASGAVSLPSIQQADLE